MKIALKIIHVNELEKLTEFFNSLNITEFLIVPTEYYNLGNSYREISDRKIRDN